MKTKLLYVVLFSFVFCSCAIHKYNQPTYTYSYTGLDSVALSNSSIDLDSLRVLVVNLANVKEGNTSLDRAGRGMDFMPSDASIGNGVPFGASASTSRVSGMVQSDFLNQLSIARVFEKLNILAHVFMLKDSVNTINLLSLDSIIKNEKIGLIIVMNRVSYNLDKEKSMSTQSIDRLFPPSNEGYVSSISTQSIHSFVRYHSTWNLMWLDPKTHSVSKERRIEQKGQFYTTNDRDEQIDIVACAVKVGEDFSAIFK